MIDTTDIRQRTDLLSFVGIPLKRVASTGGGEYAGACPFCGGRDRFRVQPERGLWLCRGCTDGKWQDAIAFVMKRDNVSFAEACNILGGESLPGRPPAPQRQHVVEKRILHPPSWEADGLKVVAQCESALWSDPGTRARAWLNGRGLKDDTLRQFKLGFNAAAGATHGLWLARGIVIPGIAVDGKLWYLKVRQAVGEPKYLHVKGGHPALFGQLTGKPVLFLAEGEFDMMLAWQLVGDLVDVATLGSESGDMMPWLSRLAGYQTFLVAYDVDQGGERGAGRWQWTARARRLRLPLHTDEGKDVTDFVKAGGDLRSLILAALAAYGPQQDDDDFPSFCSCGERVWMFTPVGDPLCEKHAKARGLA